MLRNEGLTVALGSDVPKAWAYGDMAQLAHLVAAGRGWPLNAYDLLEMLTAACARASGLEKQIGRIAPGLRADIVIRRPDTLEDLPGIDPLLHALLISRGRSVDTVLVDGVEVFRGGRLTRVDESAVRELATRSAARLASTLGVSRRGPDLLDHVEVGT
jgi:cytosine/adenosine deaminase-related metal-dependent hydrolase